LRSLIKWNATGISRLPAETAWLQDFPNTSQVSRHKNNKMTLFFQQFLPSSGRHQLRSTLSVNALYLYHLSNVVNI
jgi:hypothetical protein